MTQLARNAPVLEAVIAFQRGWIYCRPLWLHQNTPGLWALPHSSTHLILMTARAFVDSPQYNSSFKSAPFPVHMCWEQPQTLDKSWTKGLFEMPFSPSAYLQQEINAFERFLYTVGSNRLERTDWFLQPSPHSLRYRTTKYSGAIAIWELCQMEWSINLIF